MRKVTPENLNKPTIKVMLQVFLPFNDGSGGGELVEAQDLCFMQESTNDIAAMCKRLILDAKEIARHQIEIMRINARSKTQNNFADAPPAPAVALDKLDPGVELPAPKVTIRKKPLKKKASVKK